VNQAAPPAGTAGLGYQPALDGLRAVSVIAVVLYHAGFEWMHGGFFGVEVFFVISGFLITSLLVDERVARGTNDLSDFWLRRARRLLPALGVMLLAVCAWTVLAGSAEQASQLRNDMPWAVLYAANWGQIAGEVPYFAPAAVPALPERGDDGRVGHINTLLRRASARDPEHVMFIEGPDEWCEDEAIATDPHYRWDGVHVYQRGAKLIFETVAPALLAIPIDRGSQVTGQ